MLRFVGQGERHPVAQFVLLLSRGHSVADWKKNEPIPHHLPHFLISPRSFAFQSKKPYQYQRVFFFPSSL